MPRLKAVQGTCVLALCFTLIAIGAPDAGAQQPQSLEWQPNGRQRAYVRSLVGPFALLGVAATTTMEQVRTETPDWGDNTGGLTRRIASNAGRKMIQETVRHGLAAALDRSTVYLRCTCTSGGARVAHAFVEVISDRDRDGRRVIPLSRFAGVYAGAFAEQAWRPGGSTSDVALAGVSAIVSGSVTNLWREFVGWP
jgi:hypothetical protein